MNTQTTSVCWKMASETPTPTRILVCTFLVFHCMIHCIVLAYCIDILYCHVTVNLSWAFLYVSSIIAYGSAVAQWSAHWPLVLEVPGLTARKIWWSEDASHSVICRYNMKKCAVLQIDCPCAGTVIPCAC